MFSVSFPLRFCSLLFCSLLVHSSLAFDFDDDGPRFLGRSSPIHHVLTIPSTCQVSRDGASTSSFRWTHNPTCIQAVVSKDDVPTVQDFCVYTNSAFSYGRGISLITTPEVTATMTAYTWFLEEERIEDDQVPYEARQTEDRGIGLIATETLPAGTTYMIKTPVLVIARDALSSISREERYALLKKAVNQLPVKTQELFMALAKSRGGDEINDIVQTNSHGMKFEGGVGHLSVVPEAARINHACRPNSYYRFDDLSMRFEVFTLRNVSVGDELSISYGFSDQPHDHRREAIEENWSFTCNCALCTAPPEEITASNARLARIEEIKGQLPTDVTKVPHLIGWLPELIDLMNEEGLIVDRPQYEEILAYAWNAIGDEQRAKQWAGRAKLGWEILAGKDSWEVRRTRQLEENPKWHPSWKMYNPEEHDVDDHNHDQDHDHEH
ncbi:SET domain-containing protein [Lojkania enalia]|uniref:SET domain-containing protein n=1 Tax=Lojkania enalia TaxID=147567 RepID=A0A9P4KEP2_9PLEO|nr:SET domain-containing protein [Didymosphaeria enalia]